MVIWLLHSPLHNLLDKSTILITILGRKSGKKYTIPVSYVRDGDTLLMISQREHTWWRNLRSGAQVTLYVQGHTWKASGEVFSDAETVSNKLLLFLQQFPKYQRQIHIKLASNGQPENSEAFQRFAQNMVIVQMKELEEVAA
jgi:deazaflavin-dependent oxidoreductase (nitroreductase family)